MSVISYSETSKSNLNRIIIKPGQIIFCRDSSEIYYDTSESNRIKMSDMVLFQTDLERLRIIAPIIDKFYYVKETHKLYSYNIDGWHQINVDVIDNLQSTSSSAALSANQGRILHELVDKKLDKQVNGKANKFLNQQNEYVTVKSNNPFPSEFLTSNTSILFCESIKNYEELSDGISYFGNVSLNDMPEKITSAECKIDIVSSNTNSFKILLELYSETVSPYRWSSTYSYLNGFSGWRSNSSGSSANIIIDMVKINGEALPISKKAVNIPIASSLKLGVVKGSNDANKISLESDGTMSVNNITIDNIIQDEDHEIILDCGSSIPKT